MKQKEYSLEVGGRKLSAIFSDLANQANGSVLVRYGGTLILATAVLGNRREGIDFFPLTVDYEERFYAAGKILGGRFNKREGKPSEEAVLAGRIVDRTIRPLFPPHLRNEIQVIITVLSIDEENDPDIPAVIGASLALSTSDIPWRGPVSAIRLGQGSAGLNINPAYTERNNGAKLDLLVCGRGGEINMIEAEGQEVPETELAAALTAATNELNRLETWQKEIIKIEGRPKQDLPAIATPPALPALWTDFANQQSNLALRRDDWLQAVAEKHPEISLDQAETFFEDQVDAWLHREGLDHGRRVDGRQFDELRPLFAQAGGLSDVVHGTGIFYRGGTHILTSLTLSGPRDALLLEGMEVAGKKHFMHHYNFPPFSTGETGRVGAPSRRSIGHGALAEKSLRAVIPPREIFPYTIRLVSEALASNGSTSMGSVCASTLALMDGGVPIKAPVAGIAIGLLQDEAGDRYQLLTDIQGPEDHYGDMDFKVAGTKNGVTGLQLDIKTAGVAPSILIEALGRARAAREQILDVITKVIAEPRPELKPSAPSIITLKIPVDKIGAVIGPGGKVIQKLSETTGAEIEIEDDGSVYITGRGEGATEARRQIESITHEYKPGERLEGEVTRILDFGAFVKIGYDAEGLVHVSELAPFRVDRVTDVVKEGDRIPVVVKEIDERGRINLSLKAAAPDYASQHGAKPSTNPLPARPASRSPGPAGRHPRRPR